MTGEYFNSLWLAAFGYALNDANGLKEWTAFVDNAKANDKAIRECLREYGERYAAAKAEGRSNHRDIIPTLTEFRRYYFATMPGRKQKWSSNGAVCGFCGGDGHVFALTTQRGHEAEAPERLDEIPAERVPRLYCAPEVWDCPECRAETYAGHPDLRDRVRRNCLPDRVPVGHPDNPHDFPECGARLITDKAIAMQRAANGAGNGVSARVFAAPGKDTLDEVFPIATARETQIQIDEEERRITAEMAEVFGPK